MGEICVPTRNRGLRAGRGRCVPTVLRRGAAPRERPLPRTRLRNADTYAKRLHTELVRATGKLADPTDLEFAEGHLDDSDALTAAIDALLAKKPHLASVGRPGRSGRAPHSPRLPTVDLAAILRRRAQ